ncbi:LLM class flavin-dependent oxidoreductase [Haloplanus litoreus]|uniref:LLM class flavin-dependent oxidoreductase n=1 Tax=Haloplanus litoreus TaxID=767515 RepID=A0ABD6A2V2_9EURY
MEFGISFLPHDTETMVRKARRAEELGFELFGVADSQCIARELYTTLGAVAHATSSMEVGPVVTNPVTRHPAVTASAIATVHECTDGRAILGIATGDSAVYTLGERPARLAELEGTVEKLRTLWRGEPVEFDGESVSLRWLPETGTADDVSIMFAAEGPKTLRTAGRIADRVIVGLGLLPEVIEEAVGAVNEGARSAGRDPDDVEIWVLSQVNVADSYRVAVDEIKMGIAASAHHSLQFTFEGKSVPETYEDDLRELVNRYDPNEHEETGETTNKRIVEELGLTDYLADRYAIVGTVDDCVEKIRTIEATGAVDGIVMPLHREEDRDLLTRLGRDVLPRVRED